MKATGIWNARDAQDPLSHEGASRTASLDFGRPCEYAITRNPALGSMGLFLLGCSLILTAAPAPLFGWLVGT